MGSGAQLGVPGGWEAQRGEEGGENILPLSRKGQLPAQGCSGSWGCCEQL